MIRLLWEYMTLTEYPNDGGGNDRSYAMFVVCVPFVPLLPSTFTPPCLTKEQCSHRQETSITSIKLGGWTEAWVICGS